MPTPEQLRAALRQRQQRPPRLDPLSQLYQDLRQTCQTALGDAPRDWVALECLANARDYAKPDTFKTFVLWEAVRHPDVRITMADNLAAEHPYLMRTFLPNARLVRFPFNPGDTAETSSMSWRLIRQDLCQPGGQFYTIPRFSTASRSNLGLVPQSMLLFQNLGGWPGSDPRRAPPNAGAGIAVNEAEWQALDDQRRNRNNQGRFFNMVPDIGAAARRGVPRDRAFLVRLYSIKTGVSYVGSRDEEGAGKHRLESNSTMAMVRSKAVKMLPQNDDTLGVQTELLTVTAPLISPVPGGYDGYQIRDLSCLEPGLDYLPGQAIPYGRAAFDEGGGDEDQMRFWRDAFAVPLGRAKARLLLNYGLVHTSANAQNFVLGFARGRSEVRHFVIRDLGDTSWHDDFITDYLAACRGGARLFAMYRGEARSTIYHLLRATSSRDYPAPVIVRLAAFSLLTHRFGDELGWPSRLRYSFITGIFSGFLAYLREVLDLRTDPGRREGHMSQTDIETLGDEGSYPHDPREHQTYKDRVNELLAMTPGKLFNLATYVHNANMERLRGVNVNNETLRKLLNAEEILVCAGVERLLRDDKRSTRKEYLRRLQHAWAGNWPAIIT